MFSCHSDGRHGLGAKVHKARELDATQADRRLMLPIRPLRPAEPQVEAQRWRECPGSAWAWPLLPGGGVHANREPSAIHLNPRDRARQIGRAHV